MSVPFHRVPFILLALFLVLQLPSTPRAAEFQADLLFSRGGEQIPAKLWVQGDLYRVECTDERMQTMCIAHPAEDLRIALNPVEKTFKRLEGSQGAFADPLLGWELMAEDFSREPAGQVEYDGRPCDAFEYTREGDADTKLLQLVDPALGHFVKRSMSYPGGEMVFEVKNIRPGKQDAALFQPPADWTREKSAEEIELERPALDSAKRFDSPVARRLVAGGQMNVATHTDKSIEVEVTNLTKEEVTYEIRALHAGQPVAHDPKVEGSVKYKGASEDHLFGMQNRTDEIQVELKSGRALVHVQHKHDSFDETLPKEYYFTELGRAFHVKAGLPLQITCYGDSPTGGGTKATILLCDQSWNDDGSQNKTVIETVEVELNYRANKVFRYPADRGINYLDVQMQDPGGMKMIVRQGE